MTTSLLEEWAAANPRSLAEFERAGRVIPGGITHDVRHMRPFPIVIDHAQGSHKTDVDGHDLICYVLGHGSLLLGHNHPVVVEAVRREAGRLMHGGSSHPLEIDWAERVCSLVPSTERVHFTSSGTEATMLALQVARAHTGRDRIARLQHHFHGWHDAVSIGVEAPFRGHLPGVPAVLEQVVSVLPPDPAAIEAALSGRDVAALIMEPSGAAWGTIPMPAGFLRKVRELTRATGTLLIFDEVITGFRWAPGGAQQTSGVLPDLTTMAKIVAGGMPGGALGGAADVMDALAFRPPPAAKVRHTGTHNAHPVSAAAGIATLDLVADGSAQSGADEMAQWLRDRFSTALQRQGVQGFVYGASSTFHIVLGSDPPEGPPESWYLGDGGERLIAGGSAAVNDALQAGMLLEGVHLFHGCAGLLSTTHTETDVEKTAAALEVTLGRMRAEGLIQA